ncbi:MAG: AI-2E family transporter [Anaerolineae bacterium]
MNTEWSDSTKKIVAVILFVGLIYVIYLSRPVLPFLIIAALIAFLLAPVINYFNQTLRIPRTLSAILAYFLLLIVLLLIPLIVVPAFLDAFRDITIDPVILLQQALIWARVTLENFRQVQIFEFSIDLSDEVDQALDVLNGFIPTNLIPSLNDVVNFLSGALQGTIGVASSVLTSVVSAILAFVLTVLYSIYMSLEGQRIGDGLAKLIPEAHRPEYTELGRQIRRIWSAYFRGQFILVVVIGVITWGVGTVIGLPGAPALAIIAGVMEVIPNLGPFLAAIPAIFVALVQGSTVLQVSNLVFCLIVILAYVLIQQLENNLIVPRILGQAVELPALVIMAGVVVGASVGGILGALIAAPSIATGRVIVGYAVAKILGEEPFPADEVVEVETSGPSLLDRVRWLWQNVARRLASTLPQDAASEEDQQEPG